MQQQQRKERRKSTFLDTIRQEMDEAPGIQEEEDDFDH